MKSKKQIKKENERREHSINCIKKDLERFNVFKEKFCHLENEINTLINIISSKVCLFYLFQEKNRQEYEECWKIANELKGKLEKFDKTILSNIKQLEIIFLREWRDKIKNKKTRDPSLEKELLSKILNLQTSQEKFDINLPKDITKLPKIKENWDNISTKIVPTRHRKSKKK